MSSQDLSLYVPSYKNHCFLREVKDGTDAIMDVIDDNMDKLGDGAYLLICNALRDMRKHMETRTPAQIAAIRRRETRAREEEAMIIRERDARSQTSQALHQETRDLHQRYDAIRRERQREREAEAERIRALRVIQRQRMSVLRKVASIFHTHRQWIGSRPGTDVSVCDGVNVKLPHLETAMLRFATKNQQRIYRSLNTDISLNVTFKHYRTPHSGNLHGVGFVGERELLCEKNVSIKLCVNGSSTTRLSTNRTFHSSILTALNSDIQMFKMVHDMEQQGESEETTRARAMCGESLTRLMARKLCDNDESSSEFKSYVYLLSTTFEKIESNMVIKQLMQRIPNTSHHYKSSTIGSRFERIMRVEEGQFYEQKSIDFHFTTHLRPVEASPPIETSPQPAPVVAPEPVETVA